MMPPPKGIGPGGRRLWRAVTTDYDLTDHELVIFTQANRVADSLDDLAAVIGKDGIIDKNTGKVCPAGVEFRMQSARTRRSRMTFRQFRILPGAPPTHLLLTGPYVPG